MWGSGWDDRTVVCPACGRAVPRSSAREYDKYGDRWDRREKEFEYLCRACHEALSHQRRDELEELLCGINAGVPDRRTFLRRYFREIEERYGPLEER